MDITKANTRNREIQTEQLKIHGNCMEFGETVVQLSNVSLFSIENLTPTKFPLWSILIILLGLVLLFMKNVVTVVIGLVLIAGGVAAIYLWNKQRKKDEQCKKLIIAVNSGNIFTILFNNQAFLEKVIQVLKEVIANPGHLSDVIFNIKDNTFTGDASVIHEYAEVNSRRGNN